MPVKETAGGMTAATEVLGNVTLTSPDGGATAPAQQAAQALQ